MAMFTYKFHLAFLKNKSLNKKSPHGVIFHQLTHFSLAIFKFPQNFDQ